MPQTLSNGVTVPINPDAYNLTADLATMGNSVKQYMTGQYKSIVATASGSLPTASGWINLGPAVAVPANAFGSGVGFVIKVNAQVTTTNGASGITAIRVLFNGATQDGGQGQTPASGQTTLPVFGSMNNTGAVAVTVQPQITSLTAAATIASGANVSFYTVELAPVVGF